MFPALANEIPYSVLLVVSENFHVHFEQRGDVNGGKFVSWFRKIGCTN